MGIRILGPVEAWAGARRLEVGGPRQRMLLAALAVDAGRLVPAEELVCRLWDAHAPDRARRTMHTYVTRVRHVVEQLEADPPARLVRASGGYRLEVDLDQVDGHRFRRLVEQARGAAVPAADQVTPLREAVALWRGVPLAGLTGDWAERTRWLWRQHQVDGVLAWAHAELRAGDPAAVIGPLTDLAGEHPLIEPLTAVLIRALAAVGHTAEALDRFADLRRRLADELGADPGPELRAAHQAVLRGEVDQPAGQPAGQPTGLPAGQPGSHRPAAPAQLPADVSAFTGRQAELAALDELAGGAAVVISAVAGTAGVGKTALAVHWAHRVIDRYPDGQLYVNLHGYDLEQPVRPAEALAGLLHGLGVPLAEVPAELDERAARYRSELAGRRVLVVLDNAAGAEQVRPLLPGTATAAVLVTSRDSLAGLVALHGAHRLTLNPLPAADALALLHRLVGRRVETEPAGAAALAEQCAWLPLALRVAAELATSRPADPLAELVAELGDAQQRLDLLDSRGDPRAAVGAVFSWSLRHLPPDAARLFRLLGLHPGRDTDPYAAAALAGTGADQAAHALDRLTRAHLVHRTGTGRYGQHDLLRRYAATRAAAEDGPAPQQAAVDRLLDHYLATAAAAMDRLYPAEAHRRPRIPAAPTPAPDLATAAAARAWLDAERANLAAVTAHAAAHDRPEHAVGLSRTLFRYLAGGHHTEALAIHGHARTAAQRAGDLPGEAHALNSLGVLASQLGQHALAAEQLAAALARYRTAGDATGQARALGNLGSVAERLGRYPQAAEHHGEALAIYQAAGDLVGQARVLDGLGILAERQGQYAEAADRHRQALALCREAGDPAGEAHVLTNLGDAERRLGRHREAAERLQQALDLHRQLGNRRGEAWALTILGDTNTALGRPDLATTRHRQALALFRTAGDRDGQPWALNGLGEAAEATGATGAAIAHHTAALTATAETAARDQQARAHAGLGRAYQHSGDPVRAARHYRLALDGYVEIGSPAAAEVRARLAEQDQPAGAGG